MTSSHFTIVQTYRCFNYFLVDESGRVVMTGNLHRSQRASRKEVEQVRQYAQQPLHFDMYMTRFREFSFHLKDGQGNVIGQGASWNSAEQTDEVIASIGAQIAQAAVSEKQLTDRRRSPWLNSIERLTHKLFGKTD